MLPTRAWTYAPDRRSGEPDFFTQNVYIVSLWYRLFKKLKMQNLGTLLGISQLFQKSRNPDFWKKWPKKGNFDKIAPEVKS